MKVGAEIRKKWKPTPNNEASKEVLVSFQNVKKSVFRIKTFNPAFVFAQVRKGKKGKTKGAKNEIKKIYNRKSIS